MRKIISVVLALALAATFGLAAIADDTKDTTVSFEKAASYTWTVPESVIAGGTAGTVSASNVIIAYGKQLKISITNGVSDGNVTLTLNGQSETVTAAVTYTDLTVLAGTIAGGSQTLSVAAPESVSYAGTYSGTITFTAAVEDQPASN